MLWLMAENLSDSIHGEPDLIRKARAGDLRAFETLVIRHQASIRAFAALRISLRGEAEDLAQETFVIAWRKLGEFDPDGSFHSWLRTIAHHLIRNHRRKFRAEGVGSSLELDVLWRQQERAQRAEPSERLLALRDCLSKMDGPSLKLLNDRYLDGVSVQELSESTGRGYSALTTQLYRLRELLAGCVEKEMEGIQV
jgi:RNA polymerase sigma-70 factor, ECF subfamily